MTEEKRHRPIRSYVVRGGRLTAGQQRAIATLWSDYGLDPADGMLDSRSVFGREAPLALEIGFGMGEALLEMAGRHPDRDFIGVDVHPPGIGNLLRGLDEQGLDNVRVYRGDAREIVRDCIADGSLDAVFVFFPDPWHKKRHHKRRLIQPEFVRLVAGKLKPAGILHLATDWDHYAEHMMAVLSAVPELENTAGAGNFAGSGERPVTKFERRGRRLGHGVRDLIFRKAPMENTL